MAGTEERGVEENSVFLLFLSGFAFAIAIAKVILAVDPVLYETERETDETHTNEMGESLVRGLFLLEITVNTFHSAI